MTGRSAKANPRPADQPQTAAARGRFLKTLLSVLGVQVVTLVLLWLLQSTFSY